MKTVESRNIAVIYSNRNRKDFSDSTGAFHPEALAFQKYHGIPNENMHGFNHKERTCKRIGKILNHINSVANMNGPLDGIAFFCHGWPNGIQAGFNRQNILKLSRVIHDVSRDYLEIVLYACLTAENDIRDNQIKNLGPATKGGFADLLAQELGKAGISGHVDAHKKKGHTTWVPYVIRFTNSCIRSKPFWLVEPESESWIAWKKAVKNTSMRFRFPFMTELEIKNELHYEMKTAEERHKQYAEICKKLDKIETLDESDPEYDTDQLYSLRGMAKFLEEVLDLPPRKIRSKVG